MNNKDKSGYRIIGDVHTKDISLSIDDKGFLDVKVVGGDEFDNNFEFDSNSDKLWKEPSIEDICKNSTGLSNSSDNKVGVKIRPCEIIVETELSKSLLEQIKKYKKGE